MISWTPFLRQFEFPDEGFGYLWSAMNILGIIAPLMAKRMLRHVHDRSALIVLSFITLGYGLLILITGSLIMLLGMILFSAFLFDLRMPINRTFFHRFVPSEIRGTSGSFEEMLNSGARMLAFPLVGILLDSEGIGARGTVFISTLFMIPVIVLYKMVHDEEGKE
jgi:predicted MFS family arabinose efflux permease